MDDVSMAATVLDEEDEAGADEPDTVEEIDMYRAWKTCREMVIERGYRIKDDIKDPTFEAFKQVQASESMGSMVAEDGVVEIMIQGVKDKDDGRMQTKNIVVKLIPQKTTINKNDLKKASKDIDEDDDDGDDGGEGQGGGGKGAAAPAKKKNTTTIFVITAKPTKIIIAAEYELFRYSEVIFNRTRHRLVPKHELMSKAEKAAVLAMYDCKESQIPRMLKSDFMARYYGAKSGDMFKIYRPSPSCGTYTTYRMVK